MEKEFDLTAVDTETLISVADMLETNSNPEALAAALRDKEAAANKVTGVKNMADEKKPDTGEAQDQKGILDILNEIKVKLTDTDEKDKVDLTEPMKAIELALAKQQTDYAAKLAERDKKQADMEAAIESQKLEFAKANETLKGMVEAEKTSRRKAEIASIEAQLSKVAYPAQVEVMKKFTLDPASGEKVYKFADENGAEKNISLLEALVEFALAAPKGTRPEDLAEQVTNFKATEPSDVDSVKLRLTAYETAKKQAGMGGEDLKKAVADYKLTLVSPN